MSPMDGATILIVGSYWPGGACVRRILLAEEDAIITNVVTQVLSPDGHRLDWVRGSEEAHHLRTVRPDLRLLDPTPSIANGAVFFRTCKRDAQLLDVPMILMFGAAASSPSFPPASGAGIGCPFDVDTLSETVSQPLGEPNPAASTSTREQVSA